jgi:hypothetical protein
MGKKRRLVLRDEAQAVVADMFARPLVRGRKPRALRREAVKLARRRKTD